MLKGYAILDGYKLIDRWDGHITQLCDVRDMDKTFDKLYNRVERRGIELKNDLTIVLGNYRKFDPDYDHDFKKLEQLIADEGRQAREFKHWYYHVL